MEGEDLAKLSTAAVAASSAAQLDSFTNQQMVDLSTAQAAALTATQVASLATAQLAAMETPLRCAVNQHDRRTDDYSSRIADR